jgi:hypothetical protein
MWITSIRSRCDICNRSNMRGFAYYFLTRAPQRLLAQKNKACVRAHRKTDIQASTRAYPYTYKYSLSLSLSQTHTHTHTHTVLFNLRAVLTNPLGTQSTRVSPHGCDSSQTPNFTCWLERKGPCTQHCEMRTCKQACLRARLQPLPKGHSSASSETR